LDGSPAGPRSPNRGKKIPGPEGRFFRLFFLFPGELAQGAVKPATRGKFPESSIAFLVFPLPRPYLRNGQPLGPEKVFRGKAPPKKINGGCRRRQEWASAAWRAPRLELHGDQLKAATAAFEKALANRPTINDKSRLRSSRGLTSSVERNPSPVYFGPSCRGFRRWHKKGLCRCTRHKPRLFASGVVS